MCVKIAKYISTREEKKPRTTLLSSVLAVLLKVRAPVTVELCSPAASDQSADVVIISVMIAVVFSYF